MGETLAVNAFYRKLYEGLDRLLPETLDWLAYFLAGFALIFILINAVILLTMVYTYMERRVLGRFQGRLGPNRAGPFGLLQPLADAVKILSKEDIVPEGADRPVFNLAPVLMFVPVLLVVAVLPVGENFFLADLNIGLLYILAVTSLTTLAIFMAGWASNNRYAMFGAMRAVAQLISYEIPVVISLGSVVLLAGSLSLVQVVEGQSVPYLLVLPLTFLIFLIGSSAEMNRTPFDLVEAESEIIAGYHTEYSGMKYGLFQLAEFAAVLVTSAIAATLFLQGWRWPVLPSFVWFLLKVFGFAFLFIWIRATLPRLRVDQIMGYAWKFLFPLSLLTLFVTALEVYWLRDPVLNEVGQVVDYTLSTNALWIMAPINWGITLLALVGMSILLGQRRYSLKARAAAPKTAAYPRVPEVS